MAMAPEGDALKSRIYFEKTVAETMAPHNARHCTLAIPSQFVREHGDKLHEFVLLWSGLEPWRVQLSISMLPPSSRSEVRLSGGWRAFAAANDLVVGDSLLFCLRAMSEFDVYVTRRPAALRKRSREVSGESAKKPLERTAGRVMSEILEASGRRANDGNQEWQGKNFFEKTLTAGAVSKSFQLTLPTGFVHQYADEILEHVVLEADGETWTVKINIHFSDGRPQFIFDCHNWKAFVASNGLVRGDQLKFTLGAMSTFQVLIRRSGERTPHNRSVKIRSKDPASSPKSLGAHQVVAELKARGAGSRVINGMQEWQQGNNFFTKVLTPGAVSKSFQMTLPTGFMRQYADKIRKHVVLQSMEDMKMWTVKVFINYPEKRPQFIFDGGAWREFVLSNGLVVGDRLTFTLVAMSKFEVAILRNSDLRCKNWATRCGSGQ